MDDLTSQNFFLYSLSETSKTFPLNLNYVDAVRKLGPPNCREFREPTKGARVHALISPRCNFVHVAGPSESLWFPYTSCRPAINICLVYSMRRVQAGAWHLTRKIDYEMLIECGTKGSERN